ncbi:MAG: T9SS type A sorting domain-containing protein [Bacteroidetes bacterium]|nr:T9SS type A sorting domain-containing protein [Bacteroidota bacterium]
MKTRLIVFILFVFTLTSASTFAQFMDENFEYNCNDLITGHGWVAFSGIGVNPMRVCCPGLEFPCYTCITGNAVCMNSTGEDAYKYLTRKINTGSLYIMLMVNVSSAQDGDFFFHLGDSVVNNSNKIARIYAKSVSGQIAFGLAKNNETPVYTPAIYSTGTTYALLLKYTFVSGADNDLVSLNVFTDCPPIDEPIPDLGPLGNGGNDLPNIGKVVLQQGAGGHAPTLVLDGICIDNTWDNGALPVEMTSFSSEVNNNEVILKWTTSSELINSGFNVERKNISSGSWIKVGNVAGNGTTNSPHNYSYTDRNLLSGIYSYRLKQIDFNGEIRYFNLNGDVVIGVPSDFELYQNYPNPFNPSTMIYFNIPSEGYVSLKVFNTSGKEVAKLVNENKSAGYYSVNFKAADLSSGIYYYRIEFNGISKVMKMALIK